MRGKSRNLGIGLGWAVALVAAITALGKLDAPQAQFWRDSPDNNQLARYSAIANAVFQQDVDHFSDDARAMSPRSWSGFDSPSGGEPQPPLVTFGTLPNRDRPEQPADEIRLNPDANQFRQVENATLRQPRRFYETKPLKSDPSGSLDDSTASPLPDGYSAQEQDVPTPADSGRTEKQSTEKKSESKPKASGEPQSRLEPYEGPAYSQGLSSELEDYGGVSSRVDQSQGHFIDHSDGLSSLYHGDSPQGDFCSDCGLPRGPGRYPQSRPARAGRASNRKSDDGTSNRFRLLSSSRGRKGSDETDERQACMCGDGSCDETDSACCPQAKFNSALGHRSPNPVTGQFVGSSADTFSFEEDMHFPSGREILAQSVGFGEVEFMFLQPSFQGNAAISVTGPGSGQSLPFNFDLEPAFRVNAGFESEYGPGFAGEYFQYDNNSDLANFTSDGTRTGETRLYQIGPNTWTELVASNAGQSIDALHSLEVHSSSIYAFKALQFKRAYVNGRFGIQVASIDQKLEAELRDAGGNLLGRLRGVSNLNAIGPRFGIDYVRRIGHTPMELVSSSTGSILFGDRDQIVENTWSNEFSSIGADEFVTMIDIFLGVQGKRYSGEKRNITFRMGWVNQTWIGGGTAIDPNDDFGFQGISMMLGFNR